MEHSIYLEALKKALKSQNITYSELAQRMKMTESGVKKMLNAKDISFRRILKICECLDILAGQLFSMTEKTSIPILSLSAKQEEALIKDRQLLAIYWLMTIEKISVDQISKKLNYSKMILTSKLQKLVSLELISERKKKYFAKHLGKFRWPDDSKLALMLNREWSQLTLQKGLLQKSDQETLHRLSALKLTKKSYTAALQKLEILIEDIALISEREELTYSQNQLEDHTFLFVAVQSGVFDSQIE